MLNTSLIASLGTMIIIALALVFVLRRFNMPNLVAYILAGLVLLPFTGLLQAYSLIELGEQGISSIGAVKLISEAGVALLLFLVGLELSLAKIKDIGKVAVVAGLGQVVFTAIGGLALSLLLDFTLVEATFLAVALTFSSTVVVVKLLDQKRELNSLYGRIAVGIFLVQDLVVIAVLTILAGLGKSAGEHNFLSISIGIGQAFLGMLALLAFALAAAHWLLPKIFNWLAVRSSEMLFTWALCWCFLLVILSEFLGLSVEIGAFLAGLSLAQLECSEDLHRRIRPLVNFFIAVFFISLGAQMDLSEAAEFYIPTLVLSLFVLIGNPLIFIIIIAKMGYSLRTAFLTSVTVAQISEFSFIFAALGLTMGLIGNHILSIIAAVGLITIALSSYMIVYNHWLYKKLLEWGVFNWFKKALTRPNEEESTHELKSHVIVVGMNSLGKRLVQAFCDRGHKVLAIDVDPGKLKNLACEKLHGNVNYLAVLEEANYDKAKLIISALYIENTNLLLAYRCRQAGVKSAIHATDANIFQDLEELGVELIINSKQLSVDALSAAIKGSIVKHA